MGLKSVERLHKGLSTDFPVALHYALNMGAFVVVVQREAGKMLGQWIQIVFQRLAVFIKINKYKTAPGIDLNLRQAHIFLVQMAKVPLAGNAFKVAINIPGCTVEWADKFLRMAVAVAQNTTPVQAGVNKGFNFIFAGAGDNN